MTPTFAQNARMFQHAQAIHVATLKLSMEGYVVLKTTTLEQVNIQIDRPFEGTEHTISNVAEKTYGSCEFYGCRLYWLIPKSEPTA